MEVLGPVNDPGDVVKLSELADRRQIVYHGDNPNVPRPNSPDSVQWVGTVQPAAWIVGDVWIDPTDPAAGGQVIAASPAPIMARRTAGDITIGSTGGAWVDLEVNLGGSNTSRNMDVVIPNVKAGQWCRIELHGGWGAQAPTPGIDAAIIVNGVAVRRVGKGGAETLGIIDWIPFANVQSRLTGGPSFQVEAGDIENGNIRLRLQVQTNTAGKILFAQTLIPLEFVGYGPFPRRSGTQVIFDGQSMNHSPINAPYTHQVMAGKPNPYFNLAISGKSWSVLSPTLASRAQTIYGGFERTVTVLMGGHSDVTEDDTGQKIYNDMAAYTSGHKAYGADVVIASTIPPAAMFDTPAREQARLDFNALLRANADGIYDAIFDVASIPELQDYNNATYYVDTIHWTELGAQIVADALDPILSSFL